MNKIPSLPYSNVLKLLILSFIPATFFVREIANFLLILLLLISIFYLLRGKYTLYDSDKYLLSFLLLFTSFIIISSIIHSTPLHEIDNYTRPLLLFPIYLLMKQFKITLDDLKYAIYLSVLLGSALFIAHVFTGNLDLRFAGSSSVVLTYGNMLMTLALYLLVIYNYQKRYFHKILLAFFVLLSMYLVFYTGTRGALVGLFFCLPFIILFNKKSKIFIFSILIISSVLITTTPISDRIYLLFESVRTIDFNNIENSTDDNVSENERLYYFKFSLDQIEKHIYLGIGAQNFEKEITNKIARDKINITNHDHAHNEYLDIFVKYGVFIFSSFLLVFIYILIIFLRTKTVFAHLGVITVISGFGYMMTQSLFAHHQAIIFLVFMTYIFMSQLNDRKIQ